MAPGHTHPRAVARPRHHRTGSGDTAASDARGLRHPTDLALETILETEEDRGFYGGAVGWCDARGDGEWVVAIRCAELSADGRTVRAFGGGGIVAASDPRTELDETTAKLRTLLGGLRCPLPDR